MTTLLRSDSTWKCLGYPASSPVSGWSLRTAMNASYPTALLLGMTSNTAPAPYVASASSSYSSTYYAYKAFNGTNSSNTDCWISASGQTTGWLAINLGDQKPISRYAVTSRNDSSTGPTAAPRSWTFEGSNDETNWTVLDTRTNETGWSFNETREYAVSLADYYRHYRLNISANNGHTSCVAVGELTLFTGMLITTSLILEQGMFRLAQAPGSGQCILVSTSLCGMQATDVPVINWDGDEQGVTFEVDVSFDGGTNWSGWQVVARGGALPGVDQNTNLDNVYFRYRLTLTSETDISPVVSNIRLENVVGWDEALYDDSSWAAVYDNGAYGISPWTTQVANWPDSQARWIWDRASTSSAPAGSVYFRKKFTLDQPEWITVAFACDDKAELYVDGQYLLGGAGYTSIAGNSIYLPAGEHVIAIKGTNNAAGTAGLLVTARDAFVGLADMNIRIGTRQAQSFSGVRLKDITVGFRQLRSFSGVGLENITVGLRQERNLTAKVYIVDIFNTGPSARKVGDYFLGMRASMDQETPPPPPPGSGGTTARMRRFPFSWLPPVHQRWRPAGTV